jgi:cysteinyl-tRNA synthetase
LKAVTKVESLFNFDNMNAKYFFVSLAFAAVMLTTACKKEAPQIDYRAEMRAFVQKINMRGEQLKPGFLVVPQNGEALLTTDGTPAGTPETNFINAIDGFGREELLYGYNNVDDELTPAEEKTNWEEMCSLGNSLGKKILVTDYCFTPSKMDDSYSRNAALGFISFAASSRELDNVPAYPASPFNMNTDSVDGLNGRNFLYLINPEKFADKESYLRALEQSHYDIILIDLYWTGGDEPEALTATEVARLRTKPGGGTRTLLCYMSIGQAESYRYYWSPLWNAQPPAFIVGEDQSWIDNFYVNYWDANWQDVICGSGDSYLKRITDAGFDGVYLDLVNAYEFFEER